MKINLNAIYSQNLIYQTGKIWLFHGSDDTWFEAIRRDFSTLHHVQFTDVNNVFLNIQESNQPTLFSQKKTETYFCALNVSQQHHALLTNFMQNAPTMPSAYGAIFFSTKLRAHHSLLKFAQQQHDVYAVALYDISPSVIAQILRFHLHRLRLSMESDAIDYLTHHILHLRQWQSVLDKLQLIPQSSITLSLVQNYFDDEKNTVFSCVPERLLCKMPFKNRAKLLENYEYTLCDVRALLLYVSQLWRIKHLVMTGTTIHEALSQMNPPIFFKHQEMFKQNLSTWSLEQLGEAINILCQLEHHVKQHENLRPHTVFFQKPWH